MNIEGYAACIERDYLARNWGASVAIQPPRHSSLGDSVARVLSVEAEGVCASYHAGAEIYRRRSKAGAVAAFDADLGLDAYAAWISEAA